MNVSRTEEQSIKRQPVTQALPLHAVTFFAVHGLFAEGDARQGGKLEDDN